jgi:hypothetical protein
MLDTDALIRPTTAARMLGVTRDCIHKRLAAGTLQAVVIDGQMFMDRSTVARACALKHRARLRVQRQRREGATVTNDNEEPSAVSALILQP